MRSLIPILVVLACPVGMCLVPMLLMRRRGGAQTSCHQAPRKADEAELARLREEPARLWDDRSGNVVR